MLDEDLDDLPYIELLYRYLPGSGYNLDEYKDSEVYKPGKQYGNVTENVKSTVKKDRTTNAYDYLKIPTDIIEKYKEGAL
jgi:hypothetical protein